MSSPNAPRWAARATAAFVSVGVALGGAELAARLTAEAPAGFDLAELVASTPPLEDGEVGAFQNILRPRDERDLVYDYRPGFVGSIRMGGVPTPLRINARGMRGPEVAAGSQAARIAGIGDSFMLGWGIAEEDTFLVRLAERAERAYPGLSCEVLNTACAGYNTAQEVAALRDKALELTPRLVLLGMTYDDVVPALYQTTRPDPPPEPRSYLLDWVLRRDRYRGRSEPPPASAEAGGGDMLEAALDELAALREEHGFDVVAFTYRRNPHARRMLDLTHSRGFRTLDLSVPLNEYMRANGIAAYKGSKLALHADDAHPSALHNGLIADFLFQALSDSGELQQLARDR
ncbi:MAG: hypothetical protein AAF682_01470 [Planctomycetota bacterium]